MISYRLGIDIGSNSVGWAAIRTNDSLPVGIVRAGVRIFEAGVHGDLAQGREESRGAKRRQMRLQRRRTDRRRRRLKKVYALLSNYGFLPRGKSSKERLRNLTNLDLELTRRYPETRALPYLLRTCALEAKLHPFELGRALYHLAQRRGFESNLKARRSEIEDDNGKVLLDVQSLNEAIAQAGVHHTLGEYFARYLPPSERIRSRWTHRRMYVEEFQKIWDKQTQYHPDVLTPEFREELWRAIFDQRPLKSQEERIGECELEPREKRAPLWHPLAQRFRLLQAVNDLRLYLAGSEGNLNREQRANLIAALESKDHLTFRRIRKLLKLPETVAFNHEKCANDKLLGDRTQSAMRDIFGVRWDEMTAVQHREAIQDLVSDQTEQNLYRKAMDVWQLDETFARDYSQRRLPDHGKYLAYSLKAVERLLPSLEQGEAFMTARKSAYPEILRLGAAEDCLRPVTDCLSGLLNPSVIRALTEVRKIVNALIRKYGAKPEEIHIELARNLKSPRKEREKRWKLMRAQEARRREAAEKLKQEDGNPHPSKEEIDQMLLLMECGGICPYTGRAIGMAEIRNGLVQVEHIIPFSRSLDDTFINKTLCFVDENARKGKLTPWEFYGHTGGVEWEQILARVGKFQSEGRDAKLARFQMKEEQVNALLGNFTERAMNDTRYATKLAAQYVARLYGGLSDESGRKRVYGTKGAVTAFLRRLWIFSRHAGVSESGKKVRADHRHHAVDAIVVALTDDSVVKRLADAAEQAPPARRFATLEDPWKGFAGEVRSVIERLIVSHRPERKLSGALHRETNYAQLKRRDGKPFTAARKPVTSLTKPEVERIVDPIVRSQVRIALALVGGDPKRLKEPNMPAMPSGVPIRHVRVMVRDTARTVGSAERLRYVTGGENQHFEVFSVLDREGQVAHWGYEPCSKEKAVERARRKEPVICRDHGPDTRFEFTISKTDVFEIEQEGARSLMLVRGLASDGRVRLSHVEDARRLKLPDMFRCTVNQLMRTYKARKVEVTILGELIACGA